MFVRMLSKLQPLLFSQICLVMKLSVLLLAFVVGTAYSVSFYDIVIEEWESWKLFHRKLQRLSDYRET